jgi:two-component system, OmpR family, phosphate regulon sensor histidine kinase PhoR
MERPMIDWRRELQSGGQAETAIGANGNGFGQADGDFCATLLAMASHDLRQPLQVIVGAHDLLARIPQGDAARAQLARAEGATRHLTDILDLLVEALRLHEFPASDRLEPVLLGPMLAQLASEFAEPAHLKGVHLRVIPTSAAAFSHSVLLTGMVRNLMRNAIDYTPRGGRVLVACRRRGPQVHLQVRDSGVGIRGDELDKVFRAFHRVDATRSEGLGLGLFIVKRAADCLGHSVWVCSAAGRGSCFAIVANAAPPSAWPAVSLGKALGVTVRQPSVVPARHRRLRPAG